MWSGRYSEKHELELILGALQPGMTFIDVGANVGLFSLPAARKVAHGKVIAFEPCHSTWQLLVQNARVNNLANLLAVQSALSDFTGKATLQVNVTGKDGLNTIGTPTHSDSEVISTERVPVTTLNAFLQEHAIEHVDVMKIDTEGAELLVLRGAEGLLRRPDAPLIVYESGILTKGFSYHAVETMWFLEGNGYSFFEIDASDGRIKALPCSPSADTMLIAAKPSHLYYSTLQERAR